MQGVYHLARANTERTKTSNWKQLAGIYIHKLGLVIGTIGMVLLMTGIANVFRKELFTGDGPVVTAIVVLVPSVYGIWVGLSGPNSPDK